MSEMRVEDHPCPVFKIIGFELVEGFIVKNRPGAYRATRLTADYKLWGPSSIVEVGGETGPSRGIFPGKQNAGIMVCILVALALLVSFVTAQKTKPQTLFYGSTANNAPWQADGAGTVSLDVQTRLDLTSVPTYLCRIVHRFSASSTGFFDYDPLNNVTGACIPRNPTASGFKVRLRYSDDRNLTVAKVSDWRVLWVAATNKHPGTDRPASIEAQAELIKQLIQEDSQIVKGLLGPEYMPMLSQLPKPREPQVKVNQTESTQKETANAKEEASTSEGSKSS